MLVQLDANTLMNTDTIETVQKITDNKLSVRFISGNSTYVHMSMKQFLNTFVHNNTPQLLNETCA